MPLSAKLAKCPSLPLHNLPVLLEHPELDPFEGLLKQITETAFTGGLQALSQAGRSVADIENDRSAYRKFIRGCHYGFGVAQSHIADAVIDLELRARKLTATPVEKDARAERVKLLRVLRNRQLVLRRVVDAILFQVMWPEHRASRYFATEQRLHPVDPDVMKRTAETAHRFNRDDRMKFNVVSDLTTIAQIGDVVQVDRSDPYGRSWRVIELKEGRMNEILSGLLKEKADALQDDDLRRITDTLGLKAAKQAQRMVRQTARAENFINILATDRGKHPIDDLPVRVTKEREYVGDYFEAIGRVWERAKDTGFGVEVVDRCLYVVAFRADMTKAGGSYAASAHTLYHLQRGSKECQLPDAAGAEGELAAMKEIVRGLVDVAKHNMRDWMGYSLFLIGNRDLIFDLLFERVVVLLYLDFETFFKLAAAQGVTLVWATRKETARASRLTNEIPGSPGAHGVRITNRGDSEVDELLLYGFFRRVFGDFTPPSDLLKLLKRRVVPADLDKP